MPTNNEPLAATDFPSILAELGGFVDQIGSKTWQAQARAAMEKFDAKSKKASSYMNMGQHMLQNAHQEVICNLRAILQEQVNGNIGQDHHHHQPTAFDTGDHPNQDKPMQVQQNRAQEPLLSTPVELHHIHDDSSPRTDNVDYDKDIQDEPSLVCSQLHIGVNSDHVVPPVVVEGDTSPALPITRTDQNVDDTTLSPHSPDDLIEASIVPTSQPQAAAANDSTTHAGVVFQTHNQEPHEAAQVNAPMLGRMECPTDDALGPVLFGPCTQNETLHAPTVLPRSQWLTRRPTIYVSPFKGDPQRAKVPLTKAHAVRKKFGNDIKCESDIFIRVGLREISGSDIIDSFLDEEMLPTEFISYFVACMRHDESVHMADGAGYRVFLSPELGEYVNIEEDEDISQWEAHQALPVLQRDIEDVDPTKVKLFLLPIMEEEHFSVYCINFIHDRIDVLDSSPDVHTEYHQILGDRIIPRLNLMFQLATDYTMKQFTRFKRPIIDVCMQSHDNDCGFFAIKFMELWNGESFHVPILTENIRQYRSQLLFYGIYHPINEVKKLPAGLEAHRPRR